ncbi:hypothetical protein HID58_011706 [Brassica napus]|uniref:Leucine-rich repeat-containing N-terminal plant-type domain-containing protein n=2 Tax=Brassica napus TaxID=3708 RepID=A0ABQ8DZ30_BRANA|nr:hypothetical protein HID58_011706 [Brassica napus]
MINGVQDHRIITLRRRVKLTTETILLRIVTMKLIGSIRELELMSSDVNLVVYRLCLHFIIILLVLEVVFPSHSICFMRLLMRNLYFYVLCFCTFAVVKAGSSPQNNTGIRLDALFAILGDFGYHPVLAETWKGNSPCDNWFGLICVEGHIKYIFLMSMNLTGSISPRFADLTSVHVIDLSQNLLTGTIPFELTKMKLRFLDLSHNQLHGKIPRFQTLVPVTEGNPEIVTAAGIIRVPLGRGDKETAGVGGFYVWIMVLGFVLIGGAVFLFYLAKKLNHPV